MRLKITAALVVIATLSGAHVATAAPKKCPPGLAKKSVPCVPPGQAKKGGYDDTYIYRRGDRLQGDYRLIRRPGDYGLAPNETYYRAGGQVYRVDRDTKEVLDLIGAVVNILN